MYQMGEAHILRGAEVIQSPAEAVFKVLTDIHQHYQQFTPSVISIEILTPGQQFGKGFQWRESKRVLFLREDCYFTVTDFEEEKLCYGVCLDDGFNVIQFEFKVQPLGPDCSQVSYCVECRTRWSSETVSSQPSERLARMMEKQDAGLLVKRLKAHIETTAAVRCC